MARSDSAYSCSRAKKKCTTCAGGSEGVHVHACMPPCVNNLCIVESSRAAFFTMMMMTVLHVLRAEKGLGNLSWLGDENLSSFPVHVTFITLPIPIMHVLSGLRNFDVRQPS